MALFFPDRLPRGVSCAIDNLRVLLVYPTIWEALCKVLPYMVKKWP